MTEVELRSYRRRLLAFKKRLVGDLTVLEEEALRAVGGEASGGLSDVPVHPADLGTDHYEEEVALGLLENEDQLLTEINDALERIEQGAGSVDRRGSSRPYLWILRSKVRVLIPSSAAVRRRL